MNFPVMRGATREEFGASQSTALQLESASSALAAQAKSAVEARYIMAMRQPRDWDQVRTDILRECKRPSFANNKSAYYKKPIGKGVEGLGIRFVEVALRCMKNVLNDTMTTYEDELKEVIRVTVTDLEANLTYNLDIRVSKTVERSKPSDDGSYLSMRMNSYNKPVFTVPALDDDLLNKRGALISKATRVLGLRIIPGDIQDEATEIIKAVRLDEAARDPDAERKRIADAFAEIGVKPMALAEYLGHDLGTCTPIELTDLRAIYGAIRDGEASWQTVMENKAEQSGNSDANSGNGGNAGAGASGTSTSPKTGELPICTDEKFAKKTPEWRKLLLEKRKTQDELIATIETKDRLTEEQKMVIDSWSHEND